MNSPPQSHLIAFHLINLHRVYSFLSPQEKARMSEAVCELLVREGCCINYVVEVSFKLVERASARWTSLSRDALSLRSTSMKMPWGGRPSALPSSAEAGRKGSVLTKTLTSTHSLSHRPSTAVELTDPQ